jgi:hypothetical protein
MFSTVLPEKFLLVRRTEREMIKMYISLYVKYPLLCPILKER